MFDTARPATRVTLTVLLAGAVALQLLMPLVGANPELHVWAVGLLGFIVGMVAMSIVWLLCAVPNADVRPATLNFLLLVATLGPGFAVLLTWLFGDDAGMAS
jgi:hypothetical protein